MNKEIELLLDSLDMCTSLEDNEKVSIQVKDIKLILSYITTLQQENKELIEMVVRMSEEIKLMKVSYAELQNKLIECNTDRIRLQQENKELHERIDKGIRYMNNTFNITNVKDMIDIMNRLEEILKDSDVNE